MGPLPRRLLLLPALAFIAQLLAGCGSTSPVTPASAYPSLTGNWQIQTAPPTGGTFSTANARLLVGDLVSSGSQVSGTVQFSDLTNLLAPCTAPGTLLALTGTVTTSGAVSLTSSSFSGSIITVTFTIPTPPVPFNTAVLTIAGGPCALAATSATAGLIPDISGTYAGTVNVTNLLNQVVSTGTVNLQLTQGSSPNALGQFPLTGNLSTVSGPCTTTVALTGTVGGVGFRLTAPNPLAPTLPNVTVFGGTDPAVPSALTTFTASFFTNPCTYDSLQGNLTRQ